MIYRYTASNHQELCRAWVAQIRRHKTGHPFDPVTVVVPNMDMARWLQLQLADVAGISANIRFVLPAAWLREQFEALNPAVKDVLLDKSHLQWMIYTLLEEDNGTAPWSHLNHWVDKIASRASGDGGASRSSGDGGAVSKSRWDIASQLADAFDQYIMYRPDWLVTWQGENLSSEDSLGELPTGEAAHWQSALWSALCSRWPNIPNRANLWYAYMRGLAAGESAGSLAAASGDTSSGASPGASTRALAGTSNNTSSGTSQDTSFAASPGANPIFAYGLSALPLPIMRSFARHARSTDWHWFVQRRTISERSYLTDLNNYSREQATVFAEVLQKEGVDGGVVRVDGGVMRLDSGEVHVDGGVMRLDGGEVRLDSGEMRVDADSTQSRPEPVNNLQRIQGAVADDVPLAMDEADAGSVRVHVCHSARREVEVLYDSLLDLFNTTDVRPGDVAVVTPDPDAYRPFVEEVFRGGGRQMAVHVAGARRGAGDVGAEVMLRALKLIGTRYKVPDVLDWLEAEPVLGAITERSGLRHTLHNWILRQRIRWGIDARQLNRSGFPLSGRHTWKHGIDRLLLSWMASEGEDVVVQDILTGSTVAGQDTGALLGRFATVINALADLQESSDEPRTLAEWCTILQHFSDQIFTASESGREHSASMHRALLKLRKSAEILHLNKPVAFTVLRSYLESLLDTAGLGRAWRPGSITFTGMVALHQLPFRVVAILGLNDGKLPGKTPVSAFDLIPEFSRPGDRSRREADRQLFLDYLLTPDLRLHLSYTGMRQKDNKDLAPSVMLTMLEDMLLEKSPAQQHRFVKNLRTVHALQPFSPKYFSAAITDRFSYSHKYRDLASALGSGRSHRDPLFAGYRSDVAPSTELTLADLQQFFREPVKSLLRLQPGISLDESDVPGESNEPFDFDHLTGWSVRMQLMRTWAESGELTFHELETHLRRDGLLADGQAGKRQMRRLIAEINAFTTYMEGEIGAQPKLTSLEVDALVTSATGIRYRIAAMYPYVHNDTAWSFEAGKAENGVPAYKKFRTYLQHLVLNLHKPVLSRSVFRDAREFGFAPLSPDEASKRLADILTLYEEAFKQPLPFFPACMQHYLKALHEGHPPQEALSMLADELSETDHFRTPEYVREMENTWVQEAFGDASPVEADADKTLCTLQTNPEPLTSADIQRHQLFTLIATRIIDVMNRDLLDKSAIAKLNTP